MPTNRSKRTRKAVDVLNEIPEDLLFYLRHGRTRSNPFPRSELYMDVCFFMLHDKKLQWLLTAWEKYEELIRKSVKGEPFILELIQFVKRKMLCRQSSKGQ